MKFPSEAVLEVSRTCNLKCELCPRNKTSSTHGYLTPKVFSRVLEEMPGLEKINLVGGGEPLLNPYLSIILGMGRDRGIRFVIVTNGTLVSEEVIEKWKELGLYRVAVSLDTLDQSMMDILRPGASVERIKNSVRLLVEAGIDTRVHFLVNRGNVHELEGIVGYCEAIGVSRIQVITPKYEKALEQHPLFGRPFDWVGPSFRKYLCNEQCFITNEGDVYTCLFPFLQGEGRGYFEEYYYGDKIEVPLKNFYMGNILETSFSEIWNSSIYKEFRGFFASTERREGEEINIKDLKEIRRNGKFNRFAYCEGCLVRWWQACEA